DAFLSDVVGSQGIQPDRRLWNEFAHLFPPGPMLEIGPGAGHFLAAAAEANREVFAVEASAVHRDFLGANWGFRSVFGSLDELPPTAPPFAAVAMFNTIEHVFDVAGLFESIRSRLAPRGVVLVTTCNAECVVLPVVGTYWSMFKQPDHVSLPSGEGFRRLGRRTQLKCERVWTGELPLETPIGLAVAARDWILEHRRAETKPAMIPSHETPNESRAKDSPVPFQRRVVRGLMKATARVDPTRHLTALVGKAAGIRALFARDSA
ncbi:MAG: class I SAM-dependent methyltransferase, partial [Myxococcota bacterium]|nr:class I SAM-dependent methyltransferase [Myxococcota bacterium]